MANINWYPGHMAKTKREIENELKKIDLILEILDARAPISSINKDMKELVKAKKKIVILNKSDLADPKISSMWKKYFEKKGAKTLLISSLKKEDIELLRNTIISFKERESINILIYGIPNVGKSTIINSIVGKKSQDVKNIPGVTKSIRWLRGEENINVLDTPGLLWPKLEGDSGYIISAIGSIKGEIVDKIEIANFLLKKIIQNNYLDLIISRYNLELEEYFINDLKENLDFLDIYNLFLNIGEKRNFYIKGGEIDEEKTANIIINEFQKGIIGKISLEIPEEI